MKIVFFGTPDFAVPCLDALVQSHEVLAVVTQPDRLGNRNVLTTSPVKKCAQRHQLPVLQFEKIRTQGVDVLKSLHADIGVTAAYGQILSQEILDIFPKGIINVHGSILPKYRGSSPIQWAIINGDQETGITIMQTEAGIDCGDIISIRKIAIGDDETASELFDRLSLLAPQVLGDALTAIENGTATFTAQSHEEAIHVKMLTKESGRIDFQQTAQVIKNHVRGMTDWPGAYFRYEGTNVKVLRVKPSTCTGTSKEILAANDIDGLIIGCHGGSVEVLTLQWPGKKAMSARDFLRGHRMLGFVE